MDNINHIFLGCDALRNVNYKTEKVLRTNFSFGKVKYQSCESILENGISSVG